MNKADKENFLNIGTTVACIVGIDNVREAIDFLIKEYKPGILKEKDNLEWSTTSLFGIPYLCLVTDKGARLYLPSRHD